MPLFLSLELLLGVVGIVAFIRLFRPNRESAYEISRVRSNKQAWSEFFGGMGLGCWLLFWAGMVVWTGNYAPYRGAEYITRDTDQVLFWVAPATSALLGFDFVAYSVRRFFKYRRRAVVLKRVGYLQ